MHEPILVHAPRVTEDALLARLRNGDDAAYEELVRTYGPRLLAVARAYVTSQEDAEDVLQSAFLLAFRFIERFEGESRLSTWLHRIVVNSSLMCLRSRRRHPETLLSAFEEDAVPERTAPCSASVPDALTRSEDRALLLQAVDRLPEPCRAAIRLRDHGGLSYAETALLVRRSLTAVKCSVHRGRLALRQVLASAGGSLEAAR